MPRTVVDTPIGPLGLIASDVGLRGVLFDARKLRPEGNSTVLAMAERQLAEYFAGERMTFDLLLDLHGTEFQRRCWLALATIPYGQTVSYSEQARRLGLGPDAARAVGAANGSNPIPIVLPCHRVIGADGSLTGYGWGVERKEWLLRHEGVKSAADPQPTLFGLPVYVPCLRGGGPPGRFRPLRAVSDEDGRGVRGDPRRRVQLLLTADELRRGAHQGQRVVAVPDVDFFGRLAQALAAAGHREFGRRQLVPDHRLLARDAEVEPRPVPAEAAHPQAGEHANVRDS